MMYGPLDPLLFLTLATTINLMCRMTTPKRYENKDWKKVSIEDLVKPKEGYRVLMDRWWVVTPNDEVMFHMGTFPQCNHNKEIVEKLKEKMYAGCYVQHFPIAYAPPFKY